jgi:two-component system, NarL family, nitrate/nitrite response regulator NarL
LRVHIADEDPIYREGLVGSLSRHPQLERITESGDDDALRSINELQPDVALVSVRNGGSAGIEMLRGLRAAQAPTRVVVLSAQNDGANLYEALQAGAAGYLVKGADAKEIWSALLAAESGRPALSRELGDRLAGQVRGFEDGVGRRLSPREREIIGLMADGLSNGAIGGRLNLSEGTVKTYARRAYEKLGVSTRAAAIAYAMRRGMLC